MYYFKYDKRAPIERIRDSMCAGCSYEGECSQECMECSMYLQAVDHEVDKIIYGEEDQ